jgi:hypothetical protein
MNLSVESANFWFLEGGKSNDLPGAATVPWGRTQDEPPAIGLAIN